MTDPHQHPPRVATRLLTALLGRDDVGRSILADLAEEFRDRSADNPAAARRWYRREALSIALRARSIGRRRQHGAMTPQGDPMTRRLYDDVRMALRAFLKQPRFVAIASITLALGIGSVTAIFSVVNGVLLKPLPYANPDRLVFIWSTAPGLGYDQFGLSPDVYYLFRQENHTFDDMTMMRRRDANITGTETPDVVPLAETTHTYFTTLGLTPALGQFYAAAHDAPNAPVVAVISDRLWRRRYASASTVLGQPIRIDGAPATVIGVMPAWMDESQTPDVWIPARLDPASPPRANFGWNVLARMKPGVSQETAEAGLAPLVARVLETLATTPDYKAFLTNGKYRATVQTMKESLLGDIERPLWILLGTVGFVLLIACANVANLFLIRGEGRQREVAVRAALGATRGELIRKQLIEALVLAVIGGALGVALAAVAIPALIGAAPATIPRLSSVGIDLTVLLVAMAATLVAALLFGMVPAFRYTRAAVLGALRQGGRGATVDRVRHRGRRLLVIVQTAMTLILLVGSGLLMRSFAKMIDADLGFTPTNVLTFRVTLPTSSYAEPSAVIDFQKRLLERLGTVPGVERTGAVSNLPIASSAPGTAFVVDGQPVAAGQLPPLIAYKGAAPGYFETMGIKTLQGRTFDQRGSTPKPLEVVINKALADRLWPAQDPIGKRLRTSGDEQQWYTVIGVVASERENGIRRPAPVLLYFSPGAPALTARSMTYVVRGPRVANDGAAIRQAVWALDPNLPVAVLQTMDEIVERSIVEFTFTMLTLGIAALMALVLGAVGLYGVLSYSVTLRVREIGVRLALGAQPTRVMRAIVGQGIVMAVIGLAIGVAGAIGLTRLLSGILYETQALDVVTFAAMSGALFVVAMLASYLPARRAAMVSPLESLRSE